MNVLPFILAFLVLFGMFSTRFMKDNIDSHAKYVAYHTSIVQFRDKRNKMEKKNYDAWRDKHDKGTAPAPHSKNKKKEKEEKEEDSFTYYRDKYRGSEESKINLLPLITGDKKYPHLYEVALAYIQKAYGGARFYQEQRMENFAKTLLDHFIHEGKKRWKEGSPPSFDEFPFPEDLFLHSAYYKVLRGTHSYNLDTREGYPPLDHLFKIDAEKKSLNPISFAYAPSPLLEVVLGKESREAICAE